jgi:DNA-binding SARP family transcriptional activator/tetratricopeptide (TPR) repeat protein
MKFRILGPMEVAAEDGTAVRLPSGRARIVLALLCAEAGREVSSDRLIDLAWNGKPPATSATQLHGLISSLRRAFGPAREVIGTGPGGYVLRADVDLARMRELVTLARHGLEAGNLDEAADGLGEALALWRGRPFTGLDSGDLATTADLIEQEYVGALEDYAETELRRGNHALLTQRLAGWVSAYPLRENLCGNYITALARSGRQAEAIATYHQLRQHLTEDLGVDPSRRLQALYLQVLSGDLSMPGAAVPRPAQLPAAISDFTGRAEPVAELLDALVGHQDQPAALVISAVSGIGGIGKSVLAVHVAHRAVGGFPDGQLYVNLAGASAEPAVPAEVLARLLRDLGVPAGQVPADADERAARYRSLLAGRRMLLVLDDARDAAQVRPLLPGAAGCAVMVTSRARLADLDGARRVDLDELDRGEARELFTRIVGAGRIWAEPEAAEQILRSCSGLPLAIRIVAAKLAARPGWTIASVAARLAAEHDRLAELNCGDLAVRASFRQGFDSLPAAQARAFCLLGAMPFRSFALAPVTALLGLSVGETERTLDALCEAHMLEAPARDVYQMHDLLRLFATELAGTEVDRDERAEALERLVTWYWTAMHAAAAVIVEGRPIPDFAATDPAAAAAPVPVFRDYRDGWEWCQQEEGNLTAVIRVAAVQQSHAAAIGLAALFTMFALRTSARVDWRPAFEAALDSAHATSDLRGEAWLLHSLGDVHAADGDFAAAIACYEQALANQLTLGRVRAAAASVNDIAAVYYEQGRHTEALAQFRRATDMVRQEPGPGYLIGVFLANQAECLDAMGRYESALELYDQALGVARESGDRPSLAANMSLRAQTLRRLGRFDQALDEHRAALALHRDLGGVGTDFVTALDAYGHTLRALDNERDALTAWREAAVLAESQSDPRAAQIRERLALANGADVVSRR